MLKHELRQRELHSDLMFSTTSFVPVLHSPPLPPSPSLHCFNGDPTGAGTCSYVPLYECDFQFYQLFHLKSRSHVGGDYNNVLLFQSCEQTRDNENGWKSCEKKEHRLRHPSSLDPVKPPSEPAEVLNSNDSSTVRRSIFESDQRILDAPNVSALCKTFDPTPVAAKGWSADAPSAHAGAHADSVKSPHGSSGRTSSVRPLPFSVEALLRAWQLDRELCGTLCLCPC